MNLSGKKLCYLREMCSRTASFIHFWLANHLINWRLFDERSFRKIRGSTKYFGLCVAPQRMPFYEHLVLCVCGARAMCSARIFHFGQSVGASIAERAYRTTIYSDTFLYPIFGAINKVIPYVVHLIT